MSNWVKMGSSGTNVLSDYTNAKDSGLVADGVTDNTVKMQQLVDSLNANGGGVIYVPKGTYYFASSVYWKSNVSLIGAGMGLTIFKIGEATQDGYSLFQQLTQETKNVFFNNFTVDGYSQTMVTYSHKGKAFYFQKVVNGVWRDLELRGTPSTALGIDYLNNVTIDGIIAKDCGRLWTKPTGPGGAGIGIGTGYYTLENFIITNCQTYNCGHFGIFIEHQGIFGEVAGAAKGVVIDSCITVGGQYHGIGVRGGENITISNCQSYENDGYGIYVEYKSNKVKITNCTVSENLMGGIGLDGNSQLDNVVISDNLCTANTGNGISVFKDNLVASVACSNIDIKMNNLSKNTSAGLYVGTKTVNPVTSNYNTDIGNGV